MVQFGRQVALDNDQVTELLLEALTESEKRKHVCETRETSRERHETHGNTSHATLDVNRLTFVICFPFLISLWHSLIWVELILLLCTPEDFALEVLPPGNFETF